jgi:hypothetical protein
MASMAERKNDDSGQMFQKNIFLELSNQNRCKRLFDERNRLVGGQDVVPRKHPSGCHDRGERGNLALFRGFGGRNACFSAAT